jgi:imidazolonepropionase-like amidohydrolase
MQSNPCRTRSIVAPKLVRTVLAGAVAALAAIPGLLTDPRFILVPPNFAVGLNVPPPTPAQMATVINDAIQQARVCAAGALVANGTDSPPVTPGIQLHLNLRAAGMVLRNYVALQTVTINAT